MKSIPRNLKALAHMKWVSVSGFHLSVAGVLGFAGLVLTLLRGGKLRYLGSLARLSEREERSAKLCSVPGLQNLGNNCFLNVVLQALASCSYVQPFLLKIIEEGELSRIEEYGESLPLAVALAALLEELSVFSERRAVLSPRKVMLGMAQYIQNFNLTSQQDAEEAFLHLLSSLREESSDCFNPSPSSLAKAFASSNRRILSSKRMEEESEQKRWQQHFLGPFDGILSSILMCQSCSSQISLDFQFFHSLHLSPVLDSGSNILVGCTLEDCLKKFVIAEQIETYRCSRCWHSAGIKYLSLIGANEIERNNMRTCAGQDSCNCQSFFLHLEKFPWSKNISCTLKQLSIARCPKILCIHLQRASINEFGELVKHQGHVAFPVILDLFPFITSGVGIKNWEGNVQSGQVKLQSHQPGPSPYPFNMQYDTRKLNCTYGLTENIYSKVLAADDPGCTTHTEAFLGDLNLPPKEGCSKTAHTDMCMLFHNEVSVDCQSFPSGSHLYRLVSVVEHFGRVGGGHYTVYRSVRDESHEEDSAGPSEATISHWFSISDSEVHGVLEHDVLAAEASLLFYERIVEG